jgi:c-di-GMP-binding flagellar brake protein YcgR
MKDIGIEINGNIVIYFDDCIYKCTVQDVNEDYLMINLPLGEGSYLYFDDGQEVEMNYYSDSCYYTFMTKVIRKEKENNIILYRLGLPFNIKKIQRRDFVRVDLIENLFIQKKVNSEEKLLKAVVLNLSGGGMRISLAEDLDEDDEIIAHLLLEDGKLLVRGRIVREIEKRGKNQIYGVQFIDINENIRDKIVKKVFSLIRKQREVV